MSNPYELNKVLLSYDPSLTILSCGEFKDDIVLDNPVLFREIICVAKKIGEISTEPKKDLECFLKGLVLSKPYSQSDFIKNIDAAASLPHTDISAIVNTFLETSFESTNKELYLKMKHFRFKMSHGGFQTINSRDPSEVKLYVE